MTPELLTFKTERFLYGLMKQASSFSFIDFLERWNISREEYEEIASNLADKLGIDREKAKLFQMESEDKQ